MKEEYVYFVSVTNERTDRRMDLHFFEISSLYWIDGI